jgi:DedD protein
LREELEDYFCKFSFGQFITLAILELATLFFVFYMGARYGPELFNNNQSVVQREHLIIPDSEPKTVEEIIGKTGYTYPDLLTDSSSDKVSRPIVKTVEPPQTNRVETNLAKAEKAPELRLRSKVKNDYKFTVQVGSYQTPTDASSAIDRWRNKGYDSFMSIGEIPNKGTWYRVRVGGFKTRDEAETFMGSFRKKEKVPAFVVLASN